MIKEDIKKILHSDSFTINVIRDFAELEWRLDLVLIRYFTAQERFIEFGDLFISKLSMVQKIDILRKMKFYKVMTSQKSLIKSLEKLGTFWHMHIF